MRGEADVRARILADERELQRLAEEILHLTARVQRADAGWRTDLEILADRMERRRTLQAQIDSLQWVISSSEARLAG